ncbi:MFS transporter [Nocardia blacklockiae]|uniref:MFS transporter n=1 Tax=Nocardia blacklockiae TaxID=480036 RepID=UPI001893E81A|nr:MFS transporter [Nocardia blacklockiae]MBF6170711.1 MFS transporter [Nocardia blacklockiae]
MSAGARAGSAAPNPLRVKDFRRYFAGTSISLLGSAMSPVALSFAILQSSHSAVDLGLVLTCRTVPQLVLILLGGAFADRFSRAAILLWSNAGAGLTQGVVALLLLTGRYDLVAIMALSFANGALVAFAGPATRGIVPQLLDTSMLRRANSLLVFWRNSTKVCGPALAGVLTASIGGGWAIAFDALTYGIAAVCMASLSLPRPIAGGRRLSAEIVEGWGEFRATTWAWTVVLGAGVTNLLFVGVWNVLGPMIADRTFGAAGWGVVLGARAVGVIVSSAAMYRAAPRRLLAVGQISTVLGAAPLLALGLFPQFGVVAGAAFVAGVGSGIFGPAWETSLQEHVPRELISRVSSYDDLASFAGVPIGQLAAAPLALACGFSAVATGAGAIWLTVALLPLLSPAVRQLTHGISGAVAPSGRSE